MSERMNVQQFIESSPLNWSVEKFPALMEVNGKMQKVPNRFFTARVDNDGTVTPFEAVAAGYTVIQNVDGFRFLTELVDTGELLIDSALELSGGKTIAISTRLPEQVEILDSPVDTHLVFGTNHARGGSAVIFSHNNALWCANQLAATKVAKKYKITIRHSRNAFMRLEDARHGLRLSFKHTAEMKQLLEGLATEPISKTYYNNFLRDVTQLDKYDEKKQPRAHRTARGMCYAIHDISRNADYMDHYRNTKAGLYQAVTDYVSNVAVKKFRGDADRYKMKLAQGHPLTDRALELLTA